jgi:peptide/nickel transport system substrate-binding protein
MIRSGPLVPAVLLAGLLLPAVAFAQQPFQCGRKGGDMVFGLEANVAGLDQHASAAGSTRDVSINIYESLITRDDNFKPILQLAQSVDVSPDQRVFTFKLRPGIKFHSGKIMTSDDVIASFERYKKLGVSRYILELADHWEAPDPNTFVITLKQPQPIYLEMLSYFTVPMVIIPRENADAPAMQLPAVGTGPYQVSEFIPNNVVKLRRFEDFQPDTRYTEATGFGGYKIACLDTITERMITEAGARVAALETGEIQGMETVPTTSQKRLAANKSIRILRLENYQINVTYPNFSLPPTNNLKVRQAIQAALDMNEIMDAASDGDYKLNPSLQFPGTTYYSDAGKETYNQHDLAKAKRLLAEGGYKGEKVTLMTTHEYPYMYNAAVVMAQELKAVGINAELLVLDWPTALQKSMTETKDWNFFYTGWVTIVALGGAQSLSLIADPTNVYKPPGNNGDAEFMQYFNQIANSISLADRQAAFAKAQARAFDQVMVIPFGIMPEVMAVRDNVEGFHAYFHPRFYDVWLRN